MAKPCIDCGEFKPLTEFYRIHAAFPGMRGHARDGFSAILIFSERIYGTITKRI